MGTFFTGLDLGQANDYAALAVVGRSTLPHPTRAGLAELHFAVRHLRRWPLGTPYPRVVADVTALFASPPLAGSVLAVDRTGVGRAVADALAAAGTDAVLCPLTITGGERSRGLSLAKRNLVRTLEVALESGRLKVADGLPLAGVLAAELAAFRVRFTSTGNEAFGAEREGHDDLVLAVALALWAGH